MKNHSRTNGQGQCALHHSGKFNQELVAQAFLEDGLLLDVSPVANTDGGWDVSASHDNGNCEAVASFENESCAEAFIDSLLRKMEVQLEENE